MTTREFSNSFDTLLNSLNTSPSTINLDEYEKSVYLTEAQEQIVQGLYSGSILGRTFEETESLRRSLDKLVETESPSKVSRKGVTPTSIFYQLNNKLWFIIYESVIIENGYCSEDRIEVTPVRHDEFHRIKKNPFKRSNKRRVLRLDCGNNVVELVSNNKILDYTIRYIRKPNPIILANLEDLTIDGFNTIRECELSTILHDTILRRAVQLARERLAGNK